MRQEILDSNTSYHLGEALDTWLSVGHRDVAVPEAAGSSARVFLLKHANGTLPWRVNPAFKVMRHDKQAYAMPLFREEFKILGNIKGINSITPMLQGGFLKPTPGTVWPDELAPSSKILELQGGGQDIKGTLAVFEPDEVNDILEQFDERLQDGWLPFLILERRWEDNLYMLCDAGYTRGGFIQNLSMKQVLDIAMQITDILEKAHAQGAVFLDHKLLHYYWNEPRQKVIILDWNIGRWLGKDIAPEIIRDDLLQFSARALHHLFTGQQAPGAAVVGGNRPEDIANSPTQFKASYSFDVQNRLNNDEMRFLEDALQGKFASATEMKTQLAILAAKR